MTRVKLPEGVPYDNTQRAMSAGGAGYRAPDTATPGFARVDTPVIAESKRDDKTPPRRLLAGFFRAGVYVEKETDNGDEEENPARMIHGPHPPAPMLILIALALVLAALGAYAVSRNAGAQPLCSEQPEWNQHNCRKG